MGRLEGVLLLFICLLFSCGKNPENKSETKYSTFTPGRATVKEWSAFTTIERNGCSLPMSLSALGVWPTPAEVAFVQQAFEKAVSAWSQALSSNPNWRCPYATVNWVQGQPIQGAINVTIDKANQRGYALVGQYKIVLGSSVLSSADPYAERVILHEMGHMFGLADTYSEAGYQQPIGQAESIMNYLYAVPWLTEDDVNGANALYEYMNNRAEFCSNGYTPGGAWENRNQVAFCVKNKGMIEAYITH